MVTAWPGEGSLLSHRCLLVSSMVEGARDLSGAFFFLSTKSEIFTYMFSSVMNVDSSGRDCFYRN